MFRSISIALLVCLCVGCSTAKSQESTDVHDSSWVANWKPRDEQPQQQQPAIVQMPQQYQQVPPPMQSFPESAKTPSPSNQPLAYQDPTMPDPTPIKKPRRPKKTVPQLAPPAEDDDRGFNPLPPDDNNGNNDRPQPPDVDDKPQEELKLALCPPIDIPKDYTGPVIYSQDEPNCTACRALFGAIDNAGIGVGNASDKDYGKTFTKVTLRGRRDFIKRNITATPTVVFFENGKEKGRLVGFSGTQAELQVILDRARELSGKPSNQSSNLSPIERWEGAMDRYERRNCGSPFNIPQTTTVTMIDCGRPDHPILGTYQMSNCGQPNYSQQFQQQVPQWTPTFGSYGNFTGGGGACGPYGCPPQQF